MDQKRNTTFHFFAFHKYINRTGSIFRDSLAGGLFLSYLLGDGDSCFEKNFTNLNFYIGLSHFLSCAIKSTAEYSKEVAEFDNEISCMEKWLANVLFSILHLIKFAQIPMVCALGYYVIRFVKEHIEGTLFHELIEYNQCLNKTNVTGHGVCNYCQRSIVTMAEITFTIQLIFGGLVLLAWFTGWYGDLSDDDFERRQQAEWQENERKEKGTAIGNFKEFILTIGMRPLFESNIASAMTSISLSLPDDSCNVHLIRWFMAGACITILNEILSDVRDRIVVMAGADNIINKFEHRIIMFLGYCTFPLFLVELTIIIYISVLYLGAFEVVSFTDNTQKYYCKAEVWSLALLIFSFYSGVFVIRVCVLVGSLMTGTPMDDPEANKGGSQENIIKKEDDKDDVPPEEKAAQGGEQNEQDQQDQQQNGQFLKDDMEVLEYSQQNKQQQTTQ